MTYFAFADPIPLAKKEVQIIVVLELQVKHLQWLETVKY